MAAKGNSADEAQLNVVFEGTWVMVPSIDTTGRIVGVDVYAPACGHPQGAIFNNSLNPDPWPTSAAFYQLDPHGHTLHIERTSRNRTGMTPARHQQRIQSCHRGVAAPAHKLGPAGLDRRRS